MTPRTDHFTSWLFVSAVLEDYAALWPPCALKIKLDALKSKPIFCQCQLAESIAATALPSPWQSAIYFPAGAGRLNCDCGGRSRSFTNVQAAPVDPKPLCFSSNTLKLGKSHNYSVYKKLFLYAPPEKTIFSPLFSASC